MKQHFVLPLLLALCSCGNTVATLRYVPPDASAVPLWKMAKPAISAVTASDQRKEAPRRLATVMGGFGNPLKTLDTAKPVKDEVADAFVEGLRVRAMLGSGDQAPFRIALLVRKFDADMIIGRTARIDLTMSLLARDGQVVYQDSAADSESDTKFLETGVFAKIEDLRALAQTVLNRTVNRMLDNARFRDALARVAAR